MNKNKIMQAIIIASLFLTFSSLRASDLRLVLESNARTLRIGRDATIKLKIIGSDIANITAHTVGLKQYPSELEPTFTQELFFKPKKLGKIKIGPYSLSFNQKVLTSNTLEIEVLPKLKETNGTLFRVNKKEITLGEQIELVFETWGNSSKGWESKEFHLKDNELFEYEPGLGWTSFSSTDDTTTVYERIAWLITPKKSGTFKITKELFDSFPEDVDFHDIILKVKEKKHLNKVGRANR